MRLQVESVMLFVNDIDSAVACVCHPAEGAGGAREPGLCLRASAAGRGHRAPFGGREEPLRRARHHALLELADLDAALATRSHRGPAAPRFRARVALMIDPTGNTPGLRRARP